MNDWSEATTAQVKRLQEEVCPDTVPRPTGGMANPKHGLQAVTSHNWRDWFRKRTYWRCWFCDLRERKEL